MVVDDSAHFGVRGVVSDKSCLDLHFLDEALVLLGVVEDVLARYSGSC